MSAKFENVFVAPDALQQNKSGPRSKKVGNHLCSLCQHCQGSFKIASEAYTSFPETPNTRVFARRSTKNLSAVKCIGDNTFNKIPQVIGLAHILTWFENKPRNILIKMFGCDRTMPCISPCI